MATIRKIPVDDFQVEMIMSREEGEFLRTVLGGYFCSNASNDGKWNRIHKSLYDDFYTIFQYANTEISISSHAGKLKVDN